MTIQPDDLLYVCRNGSGFQTEYSTIKGDILNNVRTGCHVGDDPIDDPYEGDLWWNPTNQEMRVWVTDVTEGVVTSLGVRSGGSNYTTASNVPTINGHGYDLEVTLNVDQFGQIASASPSSPGHGYKAGDLINPVQPPGFGGSLQVTSVNSEPTGSWQVAGYQLSNLDEAT
jgi:hypothetical protein